MKRSLNPFRSLGLGARIVLGATFVSLLLLWVSAASVYVSPQSFSLSSLLGLCFPFFLAGVCLMTALTLCVAPRSVWMPLLGVALCSGTIRTYVPFNVSSTAPDDATTVLSWNVCTWGGYAELKEEDGKKYSPAVRYVDQSGAAIVCLQEAHQDDEFYNAYVYPELRRLPHRLINTFSESKLALFTVFPILGSERLCQSGNNGAMAYWLKVGGGDTLLVVNCHLKSMGLTNDDRAEFSHMVKDPEENLSATAGHSIFSKIKSAGIVRAAMADTIATFLRRHEGKPMLVVGDFNDTPISYARYRLSRGLTDAFRATASGIGRSFNRDAIYVRIDHFFLSDHYTPFNCRIDSKISTSDHYPILCSIKRKE